MENPMDIYRGIMDQRRILDAMFDYNAQVDVQSIYPLVNVYITMENHHF